jgi:signal transduction histidine kinase
VGTANGLARLKDGRIFAFGEAQGLPEDEISALLEGDDGALWMCTPRGILRIDKTALDTVASERAGMVQGRWFTTLDGMPSAECHSNGAWKTRDGRLWFPTPRGAAVVDPMRLVTNTVRPKVVLEALTVDGQSVPLEATHELEPGSRRLEFRFTALSFRAPERVNFRYKLDGLDEGWMEAGDQRVAYYMNLRPGRYRFQVLAANEDGLWSEEPATFSFRLRPHFWATSAFRLAAVGALVLVGYQLYHWRERRVKREFAAVLADRSRMAREIHDTLAQGLAGIAIQLEAAEETLISGPETSRRHLMQALELARSSLDEARRSVLGLRPRALEGSDLAAALRRWVTDRVAGSGLTLKLDVPDDFRTLPRTVEDNILRIAQEAVSNAVLHSGAAVVRVELSQAPFAVMLRVLDDGMGFSPDDVFAAPGDRLGLVGMRERADEIEARLSVHSEPGMGTEVLLTVPVP